MQQFCLELRVEGLMSGRFTISQLAHAADVPTTTVPYYERAGLVKPEDRSAGNYRLCVVTEAQVHPNRSGHWFHAWRREDITLCALTARGTTRLSQERAWVRTGWWGPWCAPRVCGEWRVRLFCVASACAQRPS